MNDNILLLFSVNQVIMNAMTTQFLQEKIITDILILLSKNFWKLNY